MKKFGVTVSGLDRSGQSRTRNFCIIEAESLEAAKGLIDKETYEAIGFWAIRRGIGPFSHTRPPGHLRRGVECVPLVGGHQEGSLPD